MEHLTLAHGALVGQQRRTESLLPRWATPFDRKVEPTGKTKPAIIYPAGKNKNDKFPKYERTIFQNRSHVGLRCES